MGKYLLRRILQMIPVVLGTTLLVYALVFALPGEPVKAMFGDKPVNEAVAPRSVPNTIWTSRSSSSICCS